MGAMSHLTAFDTTDLKLVYRTLHASLLENPDLIDSAFFSELQTWLQTLAQVEGVDVSLHAAWEAWLAGQTVSRTNIVAPPNN
jgi:hypothetical protein